MRTAAQHPLGGLGYEVAATILSEAIPQTVKGRSGELGEILATELVEKEIGLRVPVRRLRYKDGRNMAMRGDDFIGAGYDGKGEKLWLLKGEAKSSKTLGKATVTKARKVLDRDHGRCTPDSLLFIANRLLESNDPDENALGRDLRGEVGLKSLRADRIDHMLFSTQANWIESYGKQVVDLCKRGYLHSLLEDEAPIARALKVGKEWLGEDHPAVSSLKVGVAIHHGRLPSPLLRELEILLSEGVLKIIVASPTLSQGLNLNAAVLLVPALYRAGEKIRGEEFANVAGRAGRAFVDVEGLIVHVMFDRTDWRRADGGG